VVHIINFVLGFSSFPFVSFWFFGWLSVAVYKFDPEVHTSEGVLCCCIEVMSCEFIMISQAGFS